MSTSRPDQAMMRRAAAAVGLTLLGWDESRDAFKVAGKPSRWNPLREDADAFRLQVDAQVWTSTMDTQVYALVIDNSNALFQPAERIRGDARRAARRAIVRAVAACGPGGCPITPTTARKGQKAPL